MNVARFLRILSRFLWPLANRTDPERCGTILTLIAVVVMALAVYLSPDTSLDEAEPAQPSPVTDVLQGEDTPDVQEPSNGTPDAPESETVSGLVLLGQVVGVILPLGCSGAQVQAWESAGTTLGQCLAKHGIKKADDLVTSWANGEALDLEQVGWNLLPGVVACGLASGAVLWSGLSLASLPDSVGATMSTPARILSAIEGADVPVGLEACGVSTATAPQCYLVLRR